MKIGGIMEIMEIMEEMKRGVYDYTVDGECSNCGECCSNFLPVSRKEIKEIHRFIAKRRVKEQRHIIPTVEKAIDFTCPFRDNAERRCVIYPVRPAICKDFRCDKPAKNIQADKAMYHGKYMVVDMRKEFFG